MRSLGKPKKGQSITGSDLRTDKTGLILDKHSPLKRKIDQILHEDYQNWRRQKQRFDAMNSQTARNRQLVTQYLHTIYGDYQIQDPLQQKNSPLTFKYPEKVNILTKNQPLTEQTNKNIAPHLISSKNTFNTPTKHNRKGLQLVNPKQSQFSVSIPKQKPQFVYLTPQKIPSTQRSKFQYAQRTAPSLHSSYLPTNSMNQIMSQSQMNKNFIGNEFNEESPYQSRLSIAARLADRSNHKSQNNIFEETKPSDLGLNSRLDFFQQKTYPFLSQKNNIHVTFGSQETLQKSNPQRQYELRSFQNKLYAQSLFKNSQKFSKVGFNPQNGSIKQSFRYCIGCEEAILQVNIKIHQTQCLQFKTILNIESIDEITKQIDGKIEKILSKINQKTQQVHQNDPEKIISSSKALVTEVQEFKKIKQDQLLNQLSSESFNWQYEKVMGIGKNWGLLTQEVNKLKWFLIVKNNFVKIQMSKARR